MSTAAPVVPTPDPAGAPAPLSEGQRLLDVFIAPTKTFTDIRRNASWWGPWVVIAICSVIFIYSISRQVGFDQVSKNQIAHSVRADQFEKLPPDQQERQIALSSKLIAFFGYGSPLLIPVYFLVTALVLWGIFKVAGGGDTTFKQAYAIVWYASLPGAIGAILGTISMFAGVSPEGFDINNPVGTNLAYYLDPETVGKFVRSFASCLDVLTIWTIILMGIGFSCNGKVKRSTAIAIIAALYLVLKLAGAGLATMS